MTALTGVRAKLRLAFVVTFSAWVVIAALYGLLKPVPSGCKMTYMYPTYIPVPTLENMPPDKYSLFLYHEGWKKIDYNEHLKNLNGVPVLFIPGNGGSYKQVRSLAAESARAFQGGPLEPSFYKHASLMEGSAGLLDWADDFSLPSHYNRMLDWFAVDLEGEHSAMDGGIIEEHTEYVVSAIHKILDQYNESREARSREGTVATGNLPTSVILVGHSMGGFVARAAIVHPHLRKSAVETILTLSTPHQSPPVALQPSLGLLYSQVNLKWREGYTVQTNREGHLISNPKLSHVIVVSLSGGVLDYQVRTKMSSLEGIVPPSHGFMIGSTGTKNVWLSMDHQSILWCNQLVAQVSHTLLSIINSETGLPLENTQKRLNVFTKMLQSGIPGSFNWKRDALPSHFSLSGTASQLRSDSSCPSHFQWSDEGLEKDLYIQSPTVTVLAMDGRRRWLNIRKLGYNGRSHFIFVTNLSPCSGVRLHLWPEKSKHSSEGSPRGKILEVSLNMIHIPSGPTPSQMEPGSQTEQAPPSGLLWLTPDDMHGFSFLTISVAPRPTVSGRPPPAASMAVGQFFLPEEGKKEFSGLSHLISSYSHEGFFIKEDHPLALNLSFSVSLGLLPSTLSVQTVGCGIKSSVLTVDQAEDSEQSHFCKLRCFPPVALAWDATSGIHIIPNLYSETLVFDSSPAFWDINRGSHDSTVVLLLVDPHCSYKISTFISFTFSASRFVLSYFSQITGLLISVVFFALMRQARAWELDQPVPSLTAAVEYNLRMPLPFLLLAIMPLFISLITSISEIPSNSSTVSLFIVTLICYLVANGFAIILTLFSNFVLYVAASAQVFVRIRWQAWQENTCMTFLEKIINLSCIFYSFKVVQILKGNPNLVASFLTLPLMAFVHPAIGLLVLVLFHAFSCHASLCSFLAASFHSHSQQKDNNGCREYETKFMASKPPCMDAHGELLPLDEIQCNSPSSGKSFGDTQLESFYCRHGILILHLIATLMFVPSLAAWFQRFGTSQGFPWFIDSALCICITIHGLFGWKPEVNSFMFPLPCIKRQECGMSLVYLLSGYFCYFGALASAPYTAFFAMAAVGVISFLSRIIEWRNRDKRDVFINNHRKHSHRH